MVDQPTCGRRQQNTDSEDSHIPRNPFDVLGHVTGTGIGGGGGVARTRWRVPISSSNGCLGGLADPGAVGGLGVLGSPGGPLLWARLARRAALVGRWRHEETGYRETTMN